MLITLLPEPAPLFNNFSKFPFFNYTVHIFFNKSPFKLEDGHFNTFAHDIVKRSIFMQNWVRMSAKEQI